MVYFCEKYINVTQPGLIVRIKYELINPRDIDNESCIYLIKKLFRIRKIILNAYDQEWVTYISEILLETGLADKAYQ